MTSPNTQWLQQFSGNAQASSAIRPVSGRQNPFGKSGSPQSQYHAEDDDIGVNRPYSSARFLGYFRNQAVYAGGRLNVSC